ncbi:MAG: hypothetical protein JWO12_514 [Frankiales bacterium]|nr:hypothetical protein [Frankiales bacterium]
MIRVLLLAVLVAGCSSGSGTPQAVPSSSTITVVPAPLPTESTPGSGSKPTLLLQPDGLGVYLDGSPIRQYPFGTTTADEIKGALRQLVGSSPPQVLAHCGSGNRSSYAVDRFAVVLDGGKLVGWEDQGKPGRTLTTADGIGVGITLATLEGIEPTTTVAPSKLGPEFTDGDIKGFLTGTDDTSQVRTVFAGKSCFED